MSDYDFTSGLITFGIVVGIGTCLILWLLWHFVIQHVHIYWK